MMDGVYDDRVSSVDIINDLSGKVLPFHIHKCHAMFFLPSK